MSAPTALDAGAVRHGIGVREPAGRPARPASPARGAGEERRSSDPVALLSREHDVLCRQACDPLEIAAVLEAAGLDDRRARADFQVSSVFEVAELLWRRVPLRLSGPLAGEDRWRLGLGRAQLRGLTYALPAVVGSLLPALQGGRGAYAVALAVTTVSICAAQALSVLAHLLHGRGERQALAELAGRALALAMTTVMVAVVVCIALGQPVMTAVVPGCQLVFVVVATILVVDGAERWLVALMAPAVTVLVLRIGGVPLPLLSGPDATTGYLAVGVLTVASSVIALWVRLRSTGSTGSTGSAGSAGGGAGLQGSLRAPELRQAGHAAGYGLGLSALISFGVLDVALGRLPSAPLPLLLATLPMIVTVGTAEHLLHRARSRCATALQHARLVGGFSRVSRRELRTMVGLHTAAVALTTLGVAGVLAHRSADPVFMAAAIGYAVLGLILLLATTLLSLGFLPQAVVLVGSGGLAVCAPVLVPGLAGVALVGAQLGALVVVLALAYLLGASRFAAVSGHR